MTMTACVELYRTTGNVMDVFFYAVPAVIMTGAIFMAVVVVRRSLDMSRAWNSGLIAEARCLRSYTTTSGGGGDTSVSTTLHHVYEFMTRDGRTVRFEEPNGPATIVEGDIVPVHYTAERPEKATAHAPRRGCWRRARSSPWSSAR